MEESSINIFGRAVLGGWIPIILMMFALFTPRRAVIAAFMIGFLFLPDVSFSFKSMPSINKVSLTSIGVLLGSMIFDGGRLFSVRPRLIDLAWMILCTSPIATSLSNDLGIMDGLASSANRVCTWGLAYWIGRAYFTDWESLRDLALGLVVAGMAYVPLCWWEIRMSPQLHWQIYGVQFNSFRTDSALFGFRPNVFLSNGLAVTMFMGMTAIAAYWLWLTGAVKRLLGMPMWVTVATLVVTAIFCKALGGTLLTVGGLVALFATKWPKTKVLALGLIAIPPIYVTLRTSGEWSGDRLVEVAALYSQDRAQSLETRLKNENLLAGKAWRRPWFGWGGFSRSHVWDLETGRDLTLVDGLWIIMFGEYGWIGLAALLIMVLGSALLLCRRIPVEYWTDPACAGAVVMAVIITLYMIDGLFNATFNPVACLATGAVGSIAVTAGEFFRRARPGASARPTPYPTQASPARALAISSVKELPYAYSTHRS